MGNKRTTISIRKPMSHGLPVYATVLVLLLGSASASAWWIEGHECIDTAAFAVLPADMPAFFRDAREAVTSYAMDPDMHRNALLPALTPTERPDHFFDLELLRGKQPPPTRREFRFLCAGLGTDPDLVGYLPYSIAEWQDRLTLAFAQYRKHPSDARIQWKALYIAGVLSHYTGDASQPLHCTVHYDGRVGADGRSPRSGIHMKWDALPGLLRTSPDQIAKGLRISATEDTFQLTLAAIKRSNARVDTVYRMEADLPALDTTPPVDADKALKSLCLDCCRTGAELTATLWYSAWVKSARIELPEWYR